MLRTLAVLIALLPAVAVADMTGQASVIDGDTLEIHGQRIRLHGIDAPESGQLCYIGGKRWRCGQRAALALADKIGRRPVACAGRDRDRYGRVVAVGLLAKTLVRGWSATAWRSPTADIRRPTSRTRAGRAWQRGA